MGLNRNRITLAFFGTAALAFALGCPPSFAETATDQAPQNTQTPKAKPARKKKKSAPAKPAPAEAAAQAPAPAPEAPRSFLRSLYFDVTGNWNIGKGTAYAIWWTPNSKDQSSPTFMNFGLSGTVAYPFSFPDLFDPGTRVLAGFSAGFQYFGQQSTVVPEVGNFTGTRLSLFSPVIGIDTKEGFSLKGEFVFLGSLKASRKTEENEDLSYTSPLGFRLTGLYRLAHLWRPARFAEGSDFDKIRVGLDFEWLRYSRRLITPSSDQALNPAFSTWNAGLAVGYVF